MEMNRVPKAEMDPSIDMNLDRTRLFTVKDERSESHENMIEDSSFTSPNGSSESKSTRTFYIESLLVNRSSDKDFVSVGCSQPVPATSHVSYDNRAPSKSSESNETKIYMNNKVSLKLYFCSWFKTKDTAEPRWLLRLTQCWFFLIL